MKRGQLTAVLSVRLFDTTKPEDFRYLTSKIGWVWPRHDEFARNSESRLDSESGSKPAPVSSTSR